jgi:DNA gyrase subunit A
MKANKIKEISDIRDETDLGGLKVTLDLKRNTNADDLMNKLYKFTPLEDSFSCNFNILVNGEPKVMGVREILKEWTIFRIQCVKRKLQYDITKKSKRMHLLSGLAKILLDMDKAIRIIRDTEKDKEVITNLMSGFGIDQDQAEYIAEIKLRNLNKEYILKQTAERKNLSEELEQLRATLEDEKRIKKDIMEELRSVAKNYGQPRCTEIVCEEYIEIVTEEDLIEDYNVKLFFTEHHYLKKISLVSLRANPIQNLKENDRIIQEIETTNKSDLLLFSNQHVVYKVKVHELEDCKASSLGLYLANLLNLQENEQIMYIVATNDYQGHMLIAFENGKIAKIPLNSYETKTNRKKLVNAYCDKSICIGIFYLENDQDMIAVRDDERIILFNTDLVSVKSSRTTQGIQVLRITKKGYMKEIKMPQESYIEQIEEYRIKKIPMSGKYLQEKIELDRVDQ